MVTFDATLPGTSREEWESLTVLAPHPSVDISAMKALTVIAAHPDDETLGAGGLIFEAAALGIPVTVIAVTDGAASNPEASVGAAELASIRSRELHDAIAQLTEDADIVELEFPDGKTDQHRDSIAARLAEAVPVDSVIVSPWRGDGHRDHRIVGELSAELAEARGVALLEYPIWMWHWAHPSEPTIPWSSAQTLELGAESDAAKRLALSRHVSQTRGLGPAEGDAPVLTEEFLEHFAQTRELFFVTAPPEPETPSGESKGESYFDGLYASNADPWRLSTRWYETRKRAISIASLPRERYDSALEIGCSVGELTAMLAERADAVLALDISQAAVDAASARTHSLANVMVEHRDATSAFPEATFDLIVLSEVGYYWDAATLQATIRNIVEHLDDDGTLLACHWRHPVEDYPLLGDWVHAVLREASGLHSVVLHEEEDFILEVFSRSADSVATREGFLR